MTSPHQTFLRVQNIFLERFVSQRIIFINCFFFSPVLKFLIALVMIFCSCMEGNAADKSENFKLPIVRYSQPICSRRCGACDCSLPKPADNICDNRFLGSPFIGMTFRNQTIQAQKCKLFRSRINQKWIDVRWICAMDCQMQCYCKHCCKDQCCQDQSKICKI